MGSDYEEDISADIKRLHAVELLPSPPRAACAQDMMSAWPPKAPRVLWRLQVDPVGSERRVCAVWRSQHQNQKKVVPIRVWFVWIRFVRSSRKGPTYYVEVYSRHSKWQVQKAGGVYFLKEADGSLCGQYVQDC